MNQLGELVKDEINSSGPMAVSRFMELALAHPEMGYYMKGDPFGVDGDFITAPEITQMFGEMIGIWSAVVWQAMGSPDPVNIIELGPGRGTLISDVIRASAMLEEYEDAMRIFLVETSPALREIQKKTVAPSFRMPAWRENIDDTGTGPSIIIANEFLDALPIDQFEKTNDGWFMRAVTVDSRGGELMFAPDMDKPVDDLVPAELKNAPIGAIFENCPAGEEIIRRLSKRVVADGGAILLFDYGHIERGIGDTLQALKGHEYSNPLADIGDSDITAHVDFARMAAIAVEEGASVLGPVPQGAFLARLGMRERADRLMLNAPPQQAEEIEAAYNRLVDGEQMGTLFKAMCIASPGLAVPPWAG